MPDLNKIKEVISTLQDYLSEYDQDEAPMEEDAEAYEGEETPEEEMAEEEETYGIKRPMKQKRTGMF